MATGTVDGVVRHLRRAVLLRAGGGLTDGQLLGQYLAQGDAVAFEAIVRRHGPMVLVTCRRVLGDAHDAEDAFQATFLVLVRKAASIAPRELLGHWLYGVASRTALKARGMRSHRRAKERQVSGMARREAAEDTSRELQPLLYQELGRLPAMYQVPLVLCYLEGKSKKEAARQLGLPEGTVSSRLARGKEMLRERLQRRGLPLAAGSLAAALSAGAASASVPAPLVSSTVQAAAAFAAGKTAAAGVVSAEVVALTEGVLKAMLVTKLKVATVLLLAVGILGAGVLSHRALAGKPADSPAAKKADRPGKKKEPQGKKAAGEQKKEPRVNGTVHGVDAGKGTITVTFRKLGEGRERALDLAKGAKVFLDGKEARLGDLKPGFLVSLTVSEDHSTALSLRAHGPSLTGRLKAVNAAKGTILVAVETSAGEQEKTLELAGDVRVSTRGKKDSTLDDLQPGTSASLTLSADKRKVVAITSPAKKVAPGEKKEAKPGQKKRAAGEKAGDK